jgi:photosystem II stability/assembly factor-like uncharacterized protein
MKKFSFLLLFIALTQSSSFSQSGWIINHSDSLYNWYSCRFVNVYTGYVVGFKDDPSNFHNERPLIFKTTNAAASWFQQLTPVSNDTIDFASVYFTDINTGFITISSLFMYLGKILKTTNGGNNWNIIPLNDTNQYFSIFFPTQNTGFAVGGKLDPPNGFRAIKTTDNGNTWKRMNVPNLGPYLLCVHFADVNTGYIVGNYGSIFKTTNSGNNWVLLNTNTTEGLAGVYFINTLTGFAVGGGATAGIILRTSNGGNTWSLNQYSSCPLMRVTFTSPTVGYIAGWCHQIVKTTNGGLNWYNQVSPSNNQLYRDVFFMSENTGYIVGQHGDVPYGLILKTTNGGEPIGIKPISNKVPGDFKLYQNYPNPFNPATTIEFDIPMTSLAKLIIYDLLGREVKTLVNEELKAGIYTVDFDGSDIGSGVYFYCLITNEFSETKKMILLR